MQQQEDFQMKMDRLKQTILYNSNEGDVTSPAQNVFAHERSLQQPFLTFIEPKPNHLHNLSDMSASQGLNKSNKKLRFADQDECTSSQHPQITTPTHIFGNIQPIPFQNQLINNGLNQQQTYFQTEDKEDGKELVSFKHSRLTSNNVTALENQSQILALNNDLQENLNQQIMQASLAKNNLTNQSASRQSKSSSAKKRSSSALRRRSVSRNANESGLKSKQRSSSKKRKDPLHQHFMTSQQKQFYDQAIRERQNSIDSTIVGQLTDRVATNQGRNNRQAILSSSNSVSHNSASTPMPQYGSSSSQLLRYPSGSAKRSNSRQSHQHMPDPQIAYKKLEEAKKLKRELRRLKQQEELQRDKYRQYKLQQRREREEYVHMIDSLQSQIEELQLKVSKNGQQSQRSEKAERYPIQDKQEQQSLGHEGQKRMEELERAVVLLMEKLELQDREKKIKEAQYKQLQQQTIELRNYHHKRLSAVECVQDANRQSQAKPLNKVVEIKASNVGRERTKERSLSKKPVSKQQAAIASPKRTRNEKRAIDIPQASVMSKLPSKSQIRSNQNAYRTIDSVRSQGKRVNTDQSNYKSKVANGRDTSANRSSSQRKRSVPKKKNLKQNSNAKIASSNKENIESQPTESELLAANEELEKEIERKKQLLQEKRRKEDTIARLQKKLSKYESSHAEEVPLSSERSQNIRGSTSIEGKRQSDKDKDEDKFQKEIGKEQRKTQKSKDKFLRQMAQIKQQLNSFKGEVKDSENIINDEIGQFYHSTVIPYHQKLEQVEKIEQELLESNRALEEKIKQIKQIFKK